MNDKWYCGCGEERLGPVSIEELRRLIASDRLRAEDLVWRKGMDEWTAAAQVEGLFLPPPLPPSPSSASGSRLQSPAGRQAPSRRTFIKKPLVIGGAILAVLVCAAVVVPLITKLSWTQLFAGKAPTSSGMSKVPASAESKHGRPLEVRVRGGDQYNLLIAPRNSSLKSVKCFAKSDQITIAFDVDKNLWNDFPILFPLLVRLFDRNGNYLTHFQTEEGFTLSPNTVDMLRNPYMVQKQYRDKWGEVHGNIIPEPKLLSGVGNRLTYSVNMRDLRDAEIVEIGFVQAK